MAPPSPPTARPRSKVLTYLKQIKADPENDDLRLSLADWLEKHDDADRARQIRLRVEIARATGLSPHWTKINRECERLEKANLPVWRGSLAGLRPNWFFTRGLFQLGVGADRMLSASWDSLRQGEEWAWVEEIRIAPFNRAQLVQLGNCPGLTDVPRLMLLADRFAPEDVDVLLGWPTLPNLYTLDLAVNLKARAVERLAGWPQLATLRGLDLGLSEGKESDASVEALCRSPHLKQLERLEIADAGIHSRSLSALAGSGLLSRLTELKLPVNPIEPAGGQVFAEAGPLPNLRKLDLSFNRLGNLGIAALCRADCPRLAELDLESSAIGPNGVCALVESALPDNLTFLSLSGCPLRDAGAKALAASPRLRNLTTLELSDCAIGDEGALALLESPNLTKLSWLDLDENRLGAKMKRALRERLGDRVRCV